MRFGIFLSSAYKSPFRKFARCIACITRAYCLHRGNLFPYVGEVCCRMFYSGVPLWNIGCCKTANGIKGSKVVREQRALLAPALVRIREHRFSFHAENWQDFQTKRALLKGGRIYEKRYKSMYFSELYYLRGEKRNNSYYVIRRLSLTRCRFTSFTFYVAGITCFTFSLVILIYGSEQISLQMN